MSTEYSADSSKSFMIAMQSMIDTSQTFNLDRSKICLPDFDDELKKVQKDEQNQRTELTVLSQDRNDWDDIFEEFKDISFAQLQSIIDSYKTKNAVAVYKKIGKLINEAETTLSSNVLLETVLQMVYKHQKQELEKELLDFLGTGNIDLVSLLLQHRRMIVATPIETTILLIKNAVNSTPEFLTQQDIRNQVLKSAEDAKNRKLNPATKIIKYPHVFRKYEAGSTTAMALPVKNSLCQ
ncbi:Antiviral helicase SLH1 domain protein [Saccharomyces cerevisiae]|nr:Antiviral helicase SLH1 domain protein [Saccharomyces cerevisiae]